MNILVVGSGVTGLTTAVRLLEAGHNVVIWTRERAADTTSAVAAATWYPYAVAGAHANEWGLTSFSVFAGELAKQTADTGVTMRPLVYLMRQREEHGQGWRERIGARDLTPADLPAGYTGGFQFDSPVIDMSVYLGYLEQRVIAAGGRIEERDVGEWSEVFVSWSGAFNGHLGEVGATQPRVIVNCAGLGARTLASHDANDASDGRGVTPARGQVVRIEPNGFDRVLLDESDGTRPTYVVPRVRDIVLGGTYEIGKELRAVDLATRDDILRRCATLLLHYDKRFAMSLAALVDGETAEQFQTLVGPEYAGEPAARLTSSADDCGLRPVRAEVALKRETLGAGRYVIHNYGHGGAGVTLSWGCAQEVVALVGGLIGGL